MAANAGAAGLVFLCNPNNPTGTVYGEQALREVIDNILRSSEAVILVDEAYHEYVEDPSYRSFIPLALQEPRVVVSRTFSKVYGMAGLRVGFAVARPETIKRLAANILPNNVNVLAAAAAWTSMSVPGHAERQRAKNTETREFTRKSLESAGYTVVPSQTNFLMVDIRRDVKAFREACRAKGILVGRPFPPLDTHARISIGTMDEMRTATAVFADVLRT
jgi:histidinol-phosphate aminotransferase